MKILAIDDNKDNLTTLKAIVQDALPACTLVTALNGARGLELALAEDPDVILLDIVMPGMDGYEVYQRLKADDRSHPIPVIFLTALRTDRESRIQALDSGADGFLAKPVDEQELVATVRAMAKVKTAIVMQRDETTRMAGLVAERTQSLQQSHRSLLNTLEDVLAENKARKQAEADAKREQLLSNTIIDSIPGTFYLLDESGCYARWNTYQRDTILGKPDDRIAGLNAIDTIHPDDRALIQSIITNVLQEGTEELVEGRVLLRGGPAFIWMLMTGRRMTIAGRRFLVGTGIDITERKQAEAERQQMRMQLLQAQKLETIGTLAGGVAHEINNPIMGIMNYAQLIVDKLGPDSPVTECAAEIGKETERVATIVKNLLSFARLDKETHKSPAGLCDIVEDTLSLIRAVMRHDQIAFDVNVPADLPKILCRSQQIRQVVMNLLTNARDALNQKYPGHDADKQILITAREVVNSDQSSVIGDRLSPEDSRPNTEHRTPNTQRWIRLMVEDHGSGIPDDLRSHIFDPFFTTKPRDKGTGLGLSISHGIVTEHGGTLWVESDIGQWTRFHVDLPVEGSVNSD